MNDYADRYAKELHELEDAAAERESARYQHAVDDELLTLFPAERYFSYIGNAANWKK